MFHVKKPVKDDSSDDEKEVVKKSRTATDVQRYKLEKLLKNIDKPVPIPNPKKERKPPNPVQFVRNVVGSSAGAGSGEYHIYRNLRKREMVRLDYIDKKAKLDELDQDFEDRVQQHREEAEARTAKKRAKRQKKKQKQKNKGKPTPAPGESSSEEETGEPAPAENVEEGEDDADDVHPAGTQEGSSDLPERRISTPTPQVDASLCQIMADGPQADVATTSEPETAETVTNTESVDPVSINDPDEHRPPVPPAND